MSSSLYAPSRTIKKPETNSGQSPAAATILPNDHGSGSGVGTAVGRQPKRHQPASPQTGGTGEVAEPRVLSPDGDQDKIGAKRMRVVELGPKPEVPNFVHPPVTGAASAVDVEGLRAHTDSAFAATGTRLVNLEEELGKLSRVAVFLRDAVATVDANLREHAEATGRANDELREATEAITRQGVAIMELQNGMGEVGLRVGENRAASEQLRSAIEKMKEDLNNTAGRTLADHVAKLDEVAAFGLTADAAFKALEVQVRKLEAQTAAVQSAVASASRTESSTKVPAPPEPLGAVWTRRA